MSQTSIESNHLGIADLPDRCMSVRQLARHLAVGTAKILGWIKSGKLQAVNISDSPRRPQYRISPEALRDFATARAAAQPRQERKRRPRRPPGWIERY